MSEFISKSKSLLLISILLISQLLAQVHAYEHLSDSDSGEEQNCSICITASQLDEAALSTSFNVHHELLSAEIRPELKQSYTSVQTRLFSIRAPPYSL